MQAHYRRQDLRWQKSQHAAQPRCVRSRQSKAGAWHAAQRTTAKCISHLTLASDGPDLAPNSPQLPQLHSQERLPALTRDDMSSRSTEQLSTGLARLARRLGFTPDEA
jgi:hypothetical protein